MISRRPRARGRSAFETTIVIAVCGVVLSVLVPALNHAVEQARSTKCQGHLGELFRAMNIYLHPDRGGNWMPATDPQGTLWFDKLEPLVAGHETGRSHEKFVCPAAPPDQRGFSRGSISFGWNENELPWGTVVNKSMKPREILVLADSLRDTPAGEQAGAKADTVVTREGELRIDARHLGGANALFLDGHVECISRDEAKQRWAEWALAPPRVAEGRADPLAVILSVAWWQWLLVVACVAGPYGLIAGVLVPYVKGRDAMLEEKARQQEEQEAREAKVKEQVEWENARRAYLKTVPSGPLEPTSLPRASLHLERRSFQVQSDRELTIGRGETVTVRIRSNPGVSREHAKIRPEPRGYVLYDLCSRSGTFVNGQKVDNKLLADGDKIRLGQNVELVFEMKGSG